MMVNNQKKVVALVGAPNSGKTTLYNWLTGSRYKTVNYPGSTVEISSGKVIKALTEEQIDVIDTPGIYSVVPLSEDEFVTRKVLEQGLLQTKVDLIVAVIDGTQLERHLSLLLEIKRIGYPMVVALTMSDILEKRKTHLNISLLSELLDCKVFAINGLLGGGLKELVHELNCHACLTEKNSELIFAKQESDYEKAKEINKRVFADAGESFKIQSFTHKIDSLLLHPFFGLIFFIGLMTGIFSSVYWGAAPLMDLVDAFFVIAGDFVGAQIPAGVMHDFVIEGVIGSLAAVLVFVPQILILFIAINLLEATGYLARAAVLIDRLLASVGLGGRSFVPLLSAFSCAVPAMMAARNIPSKRDRWITLFIIPLMTCSARLPVYALLLGFLFHGENAFFVGLSLALLYFAALIFGALMASVLNRFLPKEKLDTMSLGMELPYYRRPKLRVVFTQSMMKTMSYIKNAGPIIVGIALVLWFASRFPHYEMPPEERLSHSYLAQGGQLIEPVFEPMGVDWRVGTGLISAFAAREVFVSTLAIMFKVSNDDEDAQQASLLDLMRTAQRSDGQLIFTTASVVGLILFFVIALQCMSTFAVSVRESGSKKFAWTQLIVFNVIAYLLAVGAYQFISLF